jgi:hypothetical protein
MMWILNLLVERFAALLPIFSYDNRRTTEPRSFLEYSREAQHLKLIKAAEKRDKRQPLTEH